MSSKSVTSPANEPIEIVDDDDWLQTVDQTNNHTLTLTQARKAILGALWTHGTFQDKSGLASAPLHECASALGYKGSSGAINSVMGDSAMIPAVEREIRGKRTFTVRLVALPRKWHDYLVAEFPASNGNKPREAATEAVEPSPEPESVPPASITTAEWLEANQPPIPVSDVNGTATPAATDLDGSVILPPPDQSPALEDWETELTDHVDLSIASTVAMALLTQVVEIISTGNPAANNDTIKRMERDLGEVSQRLADRLGDNDRLRRTIREMTDEIMALRDERDGLRRRLRQAESNLAKATSQDTQRFINERVQQELAKVMGARPSGTHGRDDAP